MRLHHAAVPPAWLVFCVLRTLCAFVAPDLSLLEKTGPGILTSAFSELIRSAKNPGQGRGAAAAQDVGRHGREQGWAECAPVRAGESPQSCCLVQVQVAHRSSKSIRAQTSGTSILSRWGQPRSAGFRFCPPLLTCLRLRQLAASFCLPMCCVPTVIGGGGTAGATAGGEEEQGQGGRQAVRDQEVECSGHVSGDGRPSIHGGSLPLILGSWM